MKNHKIIHTALERLKETTDIEGYMILNDQIVLVINDQKFTFNVEVKREIRPHQIEQIVAFNHHFNGNLLVVAEKIYPKVKIELRELQIPFLEANGNLYLKKNNIWVWIDTNPPIKLTKGKGNRAFTKTGLKVVFHFLLDSELINKPQRYIANITHVAVGNIPQIIEGLKNTGYIHPLNKDTYMWEDRNALLDRWITEYATTLRPALLQERYQITGDWKSIHLNDEKTLWGGEPAADLFTNHLRPEEFILYTKETRKELIRSYHFKPDPEGELYVYEWFWDEGKYRTGHVHPLLIYADLMIKGDKRCRETAKLIFDEHLFR
ncbi:MAG: type IV toxin-antitoxin system AbiEi family antitoxin [Cyclobacteriaceae bacterium]